jgi:GAF domain-containing protein
MVKRDSKRIRFSDLLGPVQEILNETTSLEKKLQKIAAFLKVNVDHYDWVGFYLVDPQKGDELLLGPYAGEPTEHKRINFGQGICGQAAERRETFVVQDVSKETNYLSCSPAVKSEIVVPIIGGEEIIGELDIDSHQISPFTEEEEDFLEALCTMVSRCF